MIAVAVTWADKMIAAATVLQAVAVFGALVFAYRQVQEARAAREATTRPYVVVDLDVTSIREYVHIVISNNGQSAAHDVQFQFDPPLWSASADLQGDDVMGLLAPLRDGIPTLAPGRPISLLFDYVPERLEVGAGFDDRYVATVSYDGPLGHYADTYVLDVGMYHGMEYIDRKGLHEIGLAIDVLASEIKGWTARPGGGLHIRTDHDLREAATTQRLKLEEQRKRHEQRRQVREEQKASDDVSPPDDPPSS